MKSKGLKFEWARNLVTMFVGIIMIQLIVLNVKVTYLFFSNNNTLLNSSQIEN